MRLAIFCLAALLELSGCYLMWWGQKHANLWTMIGGALVLGGFGLVLAQAGDNLPSRAFAIYGGIYIAAALGWMLVVDKHVPDRCDITGVAISIAGALVIYFGPRS